MKICKASIPSEEADSMMATYLEGQQEILAKETSEDNLEDGVAPANTYDSDDDPEAFYSGTKLASSQHYGVLIICNPKAELTALLQLKWNPGIVTYNSENSYSSLNNYNITNVTAISNIGLTSTVIVDARNQTASLGMCTFPLNTTTKTEAAFYNAITLSTTTIVSNGIDSTFKFHTYALGDYDHNGVVEKADYTAYMDMIVLKFDGHFHYADEDDDIAAIVNRLSMDMNQDGHLDLRDATAWKTAFPNINTK